MIKLEYLRLNTLLKKENVQLKKVINNLEQEIAHLKSDKVKERQLHPIEDSPLPSESEVQLSKEQDSLGGESSMTELRSEVKRRLLEYEKLEAELDQLTDEYDEQTDKIHQQEKEIEHLRNEIHHLRAESKGLVPVKQELKVEPGYQDVISRPHLPTEVLSQPQESIHSFDFPGVEVVARTCVIITNSPQTFHWVGYGFKLTILQGSLPAGVDQCQLEIKASVAGQYQFPDDLQLVSGVFWIHPLPLCRFQQQLTVEIQHCAKITSSTKLSFLVWFIGAERVQWTGCSRRGCGESVHCQPLLPWLRAEQQIHFVVNWDNEIHKTLVSEEYSSKRAILGVNHFVEFEEDSLTLDIPMTGAEVSGGWRITPMFHPTVIKKHVDQFKPGQRIPYCHLNAEMTNKRKKSAPKLFLQVKLVGAKDPYNIITINLDPQRTLPAARELLMQPQSHGTHYPPSPGPPLHPLSRGLTLSEHVSTQTDISVHDDDQGDENQLCIDNLQDVFSLLIKAAKDWFELGLALKIKVDILEGIESNKSSDKARLREMLTHWLRSSPSRTWSDICKGLRSDTVQQDVLAEEKYLKEAAPGSTRLDHAPSLVRRERPLNTLSKFPSRDLGQRSSEGGEWTTYTVQLVC
ncbi:uncharacterized protein LOC135348156 [Halichondria panicea]|uniref:uncharacterized protein LOC135348156 n=1 Tax=Halichondria panicea TaxID=6063 RepID=UPI00312BC848